MDELQCPHPAESGELSARADDVYALINTLPVCAGVTALLCPATKASLSALSVDALLTQLISTVGLNAVINALTSQLSGCGPAVQENKSLVDAITVYGNSGTIAGTFRQISSH